MPGYVPVSSHGGAGWRRKRAGGYACGLAGSWLVRSDRVCGFGLSACTLLSSGNSRPGSEHCARTALAAGPVPVAHTAAAQSMQLLDPGVQCVLLRAVAQTSVASSLGGSAKLPLSERNAASPIRSPALWLGKKSTPSVSSLTR